MKKNIFFLLLFAVLCVQCNKQNSKYLYNEGEIFGGYYHIRYQSPEGKDLQPEIVKRLLQFNASLSTYDKNSIISRINQNDSTVRTDSDFEEIYAIAKQVSEQTDGAFDITVAPLVNAWGFGSGDNKQNIKPNIDSILPFVGYKKIKLQNHQLIKEDKRMRLDVNALAPGLASDEIAKLLEEKGCQNYLIEIGGEISCKGLNQQGEKWHIGIDKPIDDPTSEKEEIQTIVAITNTGLATSGNYRDFYFKDGRKYSHTIDPKTGTNVDHTLLSATVTAPNGALADAYATACMVLGTEKALQFIESKPELQCYLIYADKEGNYKIAMSSGFKQFLLK